MSSFYVDKYSRMLKAGHPKPLIIQNVTVEFQCTVDHPLMKEVLLWIDRISEGGEVNPGPSEQFTKLAVTKYSRMQEKGITSDKISYIKGFDEIAKKMREETGEKIVAFELLKENQSVGDLTNDRVINDKDLESVSVSRQRAAELKKEAIIISSALVKASAENVSDDQDVAPLTSKTNDNNSQSDNSAAQFHSPGITLPDPEIINQLEFDLLGLSQTGTHKCLFREHLPGRMFSFLNVLTPDECNQLIQSLDFNEQEQKQQLNLIQTALKSNQSIIRTNIRRNFIDENVARVVWRAVKATLPAELSNGQKLAGIRSKMNYYRYGEGQYFKTHLDGGFRFTETGDTSEYTFVIYLNDNFKGGTTRFCPLPEWNNGAREVKPVRGAMTIFRQIDLKHCGVTLESGSKHILQGMVMYGPLKYNQFGLPLGKNPQLFVTTTCECE